MLVADLFTMHGEAYYRALELACFVELVETHQRCVVALPGGIVTSSDAWALLRSCTTVWLRATAEDYWRRVFSQGDLRPMEGREDAMAELRALMRRRASLYGQADVVIETSGVAIDDVVSSALDALDGLDAARRIP